MAAGLACNMGFRTSIAHAGQAAWCLFQRSKFCDAAPTRTLVPTLLMAKASPAPRAIQRKAGMPPPVRWWRRVWGVAIARIVPLVLLVLLPCKVLNIGQ